MDDFNSLIDAVQSDLNINDDSDFNNLTAVKLAINRAKRKGEALFRWPGLEDGQKLSTKANQEYYDYPLDWRPFSIWKLWVDSDDNEFEDPLVFKDYLFEKEQSFPAGKKTIWANQGKRFFFVIDGVVVSSDGSENIKIWGIKTNTADLSEDDDETIFSHSIPICNEAIVLEAKAILKAKADQQQSGLFFSTDAKAIFTEEWGKIKQEMAKSEKTQPFFDVPDMFRGRGRGPQNTGNFG